MLLLIVQRAASCYMRRFRFAKGRYWMSPISFVAGTNCGLYCGTEVDFIDINLDDYSISIEKLEEN